MTDVMEDVNNPTNDEVQNDMTDAETAEAQRPEDDAAARIAELESALEAAKQETLYAMADTQNVRRRLEKELADARNYAGTAFARDMLSIADNLTRALDAIPADLRGDEKLKGLVTGLDATARELESVFRKNGVEKFVSVGEVLDPNRHQAMMELPSAEVAPGTIVQEMQAGYLIKDRLLRPALVGVARAPE